LSKLGWTYHSFSHYNNYRKALETSGKGQPDGLGPIAIGSAMVAGPLLLNPGETAEAKAAGSTQRIGDCAVGR
jgi:hypothetical protein